MASTREVPHACALSEGLQHATTSLFDTVVDERRIVPLYTLADELLLLIVEKLARRGHEFCSSRECLPETGCRAPDSHLSGLVDVKAVAFTSRRLHAITESLLRRHIRIRDHAFNEFHYYLKARLNDELDDVETIQQSDYRMAEVNLRQMLGSPDTFRDGVRSLTFDLRLVNTDGMSPSRSLAASLVELLKSLKNLKHFTLSLPVRRTHYFRGVFRSVIAEQTTSADHTEGLNSVISLALGPQCHFVLPAFPNVESLTVVGGSWEKDRYGRNFSGARKLLNGALRLTKLKYLEIPIRPSPSRLDSVLRDDIEMLQKLNKSGKKLEHLDLHHCLDFIHPLKVGGVQNIDLNKFEEVIKNTMIEQVRGCSLFFQKDGLKNIKVLLLDLQCIFHLIIQYQSKLYIGSSTQLAQYCQEHWSYTKFANNQKLLDAMAAHPLAWDMSQDREPDDSELISQDGVKVERLWELYTYDTFNHPTDVLRSDTERAKLDQAYKYLTEILLHVAPNLETVWFVASRSEWDDVPRYHNVPRRGDVQVAISGEKATCPKFRITRSLLRPRLTDTPSIHSDRDLAGCEDELADFRFDT